MYQTIYAFFNLDKRTEVGELSYAAFDNGADTVSLADGSPGVRLELFDPQ